MQTFTQFPEINAAAELFKSLLTNASSAAQSVPVSEPQSPNGEENALPLPFRGDQLENILYAMCKRGGFSSAVVADDQGLTLGVYNSPVEPDVLAAFTIILGEAIGKAGRFLDQHEANNISLDINYADKTVVRRFFLADQPYFIMIICPQNTDERAEIELSLDQIIKLLQRQ